MSEDLRVEPPSTAELLVISEYGALGGLESVWDLLDPMPSVKGRLRGRTFGSFVERRAFFFEILRRLAELGYLRVYLRGGGEDRFSVDDTVAALQLLHFLFPARVEELDTGEPWSWFDGEDNPVDVLWHWPGRRPTPLFPGHYSRYRYTFPREESGVRVHWDGRIDPAWERWRFTRGPREVDDFSTMREARVFWHEHPRYREPVREVHRLDDWHTAGGVVGDLWLDSRRAGRVAVPLDRKVPAHLRATANGAARDSDAVDPGDAPATCAASTQIDRSGVQPTVPQLLAFYEYGSVSDLEMAWEVVEPGPQWLSPPLPPECSTFEERRDFFFVVLERLHELGFLRLEFHDDLDGPEGSGDLDRTPEALLALRTAFPVANQDMFEGHWSWFDGDECPVGVSWEWPHRSPTPLFPGHNPRYGYTWATYPDGDEIPEFWDGRIHLEWSWWKFARGPKTVDDFSSYEEANEYRRLNSPTRGGQWSIERLPDWVTSGGASWEGSVTGRLSSRATLPLDAPVPLALIPPESAWPIYVKTGVDPTGHFSPQTHPLPPGGVMFPESPPSRVSRLSLLPVILVPLGIIIAGAIMRHRG